jgi:hypothetical protein
MMIATQLAALFILLGGTIIASARECRPFHPSVRTYDFGARKTFFIMRVDRMFTSFIALLFTKPFDCDRRCNLAACLSHRCNAG